MTSCIYIQIKQDKTRDSFPYTSQKTISTSGMQYGLLIFYLSPVVFSCDLKNTFGYFGCDWLKESFVNRGDTFCICKLAMRAFQAVRLDCQQMITDT